MEQPEEYIYSMAALIEWVESATVRLDAYERLLKQNCQISEADLSAALQEARESSRLQHSIRALDGGWPAITAFLKLAVKQ